MKKKETFTTREVLKKEGISRNTLFLWLKKGRVPEVLRDRNGHRIFTCADIQRIFEFKNKQTPPLNLLPFPFAAKEKGPKRGRINLAR